MVCSPHFFTSVIPVTNHYTHLPNYAFAQVTHIGTIHFSSSLVIYNVFCVPFFKLNLIFVAKLTQTSSCLRNLYQQPLFCAEPTFGEDDWDENRAS